VWCSSRSESGSPSSTAEGLQLPAELSDLADVPLFASLSDSERAEIAAWFEVKEVAAGVRLVGEGTTGSTFFVLARGDVVVTANGELIASLGPTDFFGELALLGEGRRTATVTTTSEARVLVLFGDDFRRLRTTYPEIASEIDAAMLRRLGRPRH
jgi:CRP-like cAMP-binding protein